MRTQFCDAILLRAQESDLVFLTGDLGYMALEPLQVALGPKFINAGIAEQNMVSVAAGLARQGHDTWIYSIAPFIYARGFEQIRNDIAFHSLPVKIVGNGGGYGYGVMGPTHHAIEDYGVLLALPGMKVFVPAFDEDISDVVPRVCTYQGPSYLRLGRGERPTNFQVPPYAPWRQLVEGKGNGSVVIAVGPIAGRCLSDCLTLNPEARPNLWAIGELPLKRNPLPENLLNQIESGKKVVVVEEHVAQGGFGSDLALYLLKSKTTTIEFIHLCAVEHLYDSYGSNPFLRGKSNLDSYAFLQAIGGSI